MCLYIYFCILEGNFEIDETSLEFIIKWTELIYEISELFQ